MALVKTPNKAEVSTILSKRKKNKVLNNKKTTSFLKENKRFLKIGI